MEQLVALVGQVLTGLGSSVGFAAFITALINVLKIPGFVKDGTSQTWSFVMNLAAFAGLLIAGVTGIQVDVPGLDAGAETIAKILVAAAEFFAMLKTSPATHEAVKGVPVVGTSNSLQKKSARHDPD